MLIRLNGIAFSDVPHIVNKSHDKFGNLVKGEEVLITREEGEDYDSDARPAYSVRLSGMHLGYIPLVETLKEEALKARDGFKKVWKDGYADYTPEQLREVSRRLKEAGNLEGMHDWKFIGKEEARDIANYKMREAENAEVVRDWLYTEIMRNHLNPTGRVSAVYYDAKHGRNTDEIGDICSLSVNIDDIW